MKKADKGLPFNPLKYPLIFAVPRRLTDVTSWHEHIPFAFALVEMARPGIIVELGTHKGDSYCSFCQAVDELGLSTKCYAVDTWKGDPQTGLYGPDVLSDLRQYHDPLYGRFSQLVQSTFQDAASYFPDQGIDLLHIDGWHTYDVVKSDFNTWLPKMSNNGIILFHDTNVRERDFGVWKLWRELEGNYPSFEFNHGHGLGILGSGTACNSDIMRLFSLDGNAKQVVGAFFFTIGNRLANEHKLKRVIAEEQQQLKGFGENVENLQRIVADKDKHIENLESAIADKDKHIKNLESVIADKEEHVKHHRQRIENIESVLADKEEQLKDLGGIIADRDLENQNLKDFERKVKNTAAYKIYRRLGLHRIYAKWCD